MLTKVLQQVEDLAWRKNTKDILVSVLSVVSRRKIPFLSNFLESTIIGYYYNPLRRQMRLANESFLASYMTPEKGKSLVDAGANWGMWALFVARQGFEVYAFEPAPETFKVLKNKAENYKNLHVYPCALGDCNSVGKIGLGSHIWDGGVMGSDKKEAISVEICALDSQKLKNVGVIKIDTEGYEKPILAGAKNLIAKEKPRLIIEVHKKTGVASQTHAEEFIKIKKILEDFGYSWVTLARRVGLRESAPFIIAEPLKND